MFVPEFNRFTVPGLSPDENEELFRAAPVTSSSFYDLADALHHPNGPRLDVVAETRKQVESDLVERARPGEEQLILNGIKQAVETITKR